MFTQYAGSNERRITKDETNPVSAAFAAEFAKQQAYMNQCDVPTAAPAEIPARFDQLLASVDALHVVLDLLEKRLQPVVSHRNGPALDRVEKGVSEGSCALGEGLYAVTIRVESALGRLRGLDSALQL